MLKKGLIQIVNHRIELGKLHWLACVLSASIMGCDAPCATNATCDMVTVAPSGYQFVLLNNVIHASASTKGGSGAITWENHSPSLVFEAAPKAISNEYGSSSAVTIRAVGLGQGTITANSQTASDWLIIHVVPADSLAAIEILRCRGAATSGSCSSGFRDSVAVGDTETLLATVRDASNHPVHASIAWAAQDTSIAKVAVSATDGAWTAIAKQPGSTAVTVTVAGISNSFVLTVTPRMP
jgi:hypothetical protein